MEKKKFILTDEYKQNAFTVPEGYFDRMQDKLSERIASMSQSHPVGWWRALRPQLAYAAGFVALIVAGYGGLHLLDRFSGSSTDMTPDDFYAYATNALRIDEHTVLRLMSEEMEEAQDSSVDTDAIINYLADARVSLSDIASFF